jgi:hypothetical protein
MAGWWEEGKEGGKEGGRKEGRKKERQENRGTNQHKMSFVFQRKKNYLLIGKAGGRTTGTNKEIKREEREE